MIASARFTARVTAAQSRFSSAGAERRDRLAVEPDHLLLARDDPRLARGAARAVDQDPALGNAEVLGLGAEQLAVGVVADHGAQRGRAPSATRHFATFAAPPSRSSSRSTASTGTGASGEMRSTSPVDVGVERGVADHQHAPADHRAEPLAYTLWCRLAELLARRAASRPAPVAAPDPGRARRSRRRSRPAGPWSRRRPPSGRAAARTGGARARSSRAISSTSNVQFTQKGSSNTGASSGAIAQQLRAALRVIHR